MQKKPLLVHLGNRIRTLRQRLQISQEKLAHLSGLDRTYIGSVERGERNISIVNLSRIARALRVHPSSLLKSVSIKNIPQ